MGRAVLLGLVLFVIVFAFWHGEGGSPPWEIEPISGALIAAFTVAAVTRGSYSVRAIGGLVSFVLYAIAFLLGGQSFGHAYNECVEKGEVVRTQLATYRSREGHFPDRLNQLDEFDLGGRILRATVLEYERTEMGYTLSFRDWLVEHRATESEPFAAHK